ncbi:MAG: kynureninase [Acidimicrobiia bacterium]|nr:MAG: kynureninase [Acidimicrobiia bacterium]
MRSIAERARSHDRDDSLAHFRNRFVITDDLIYLDGNSLGRLPAETPRRIRETVEEQWAHDLVVAWDRWLDAGTRIGDSLAPLIGANSGEVAVCDQTSINLFKLASAGLRSSGRRNIITDSGNFPSDRYVLESVASSRGGQLILAPEDPSAEDIAKLLDNTVGLVSLSHVAYRSGALTDGAEITGLVHERGALMLWDLAHSAGSVPVHLSEWDADLAVGCTYKYLNAGPGAPGFLYVNRELQHVLEQPITGWFGHADQFGFTDEWVAADNIRRFLVGTPPIVSMVGVEVGVALTVEAGIEQLRNKSIALTSLFIEAVAPLSAHGIEIITPTAPTRRGSHVTVRHRHGFQIASNLRQRGVIPDFRAPDLIRFGFTPLYTTFEETANAVEILVDILETRSYGSFPATRDGVT